MNIGVLEILSDTIRPNRFEAPYDRWLRRRFASIMPQVVAAWCRRMGHRTFYATYYGQLNDPRRLLPDQLDIVFIAVCTQASPLAYMLAKRFRQEKVPTVIGGPHANSFPGDCQRFFDIVVQKCDETVIREILAGNHAPGSVIAEAQPLSEIPSVEERLPDIRIANLDGGRASSSSMIGVLASLGCPYHCDFCTDWNVPHVSLPSNRLGEDLSFIGRHFPKALIAYHDPNFGIEFDRVMGILSRLPRSHRNPYIMECSLSVLKPHRLSRVAETNCIYAIVGVESWYHCAHKAGLSSCSGTAKFHHVCQQIKTLRQYVPNLQVNFLFGTDSDSGPEPVSLTKAFLRDVPGIWPVINTPIPFGGTPLYERYAAEERILTSLPFCFYSVPYLGTVLKNYDPAAYYEGMIEIYAAATSMPVIHRRLQEATDCLGRFFHLLRVVNLKKTLWQLRRIRDMLGNDSRFRSFHEGQTRTVPDFYRHSYRRRLGPYADIMTDDDMIPVV